MSAVGHIGKTTNWNNEVAGVGNEDQRVNQWGEMPGEVVSFDPVRQTVTVQPLYKPRHNGEPVEMPELLDVPVRFTRIGGFVVTAPVKKGDKISLRPQMRNTEAYHDADGKFEADSARVGSLSDYEAFLDGGESLKDPIPKFNNTNFEIRSADGSFKMEMTEDGKFSHVGAQGDIYELLTQVVELLASDTLTIKYGSSIGSGHALEKQADYATIAGKLRGMVL